LTNQSGDESGCKGRQSHQRREESFVGNRNAGLLLLCRVKTLLCAFPLAHVLETMRPLPIDPLPGTPEFLPGIALIRGLPTPVVDVACLLEVDAGATTRLVLLKVESRQVALMVDAVAGIRSVPDDSLQDLPSLFSDSGAAFVSAIGRLDASLLMILQGARLVPRELWAKLDAAGDNP
jgi:purine-binding chemotaxis protein CheW